MWVHAVSVGEIQVAAAFVKSIRELNPGLTVWVTTTTDTGLEAGLKAIPDCPVITYPLDAYGSPARAIGALRPDLIVLLETEIWPNFLKAAKKSGAVLMMANGRISPRSVTGYRKFRFFFKEVLEYFDLMAMIRDEDRERIISLGADPSLVRVVGSGKNDLLFDRLDHSRVKELEAELGISPECKVLVAGSTRKGEEEYMLDAFAQLREEFQDLHLIVAPRHVNRAGEVESMIRARGLTFSSRSRGQGGGEPSGGPPDVTLVDVMGELFYLYGLADAAFCGGSMVPLGGQNPLEAAVWGKPVMFGPHMDDFLDAAELMLDSGAGKIVKDVDELVMEAAGLLRDEKAAKSRGEAGRAALERHKGASKKLAQMALELLGLDKKVQA